MVTPRLVGQPHLRRALVLWLDGFLPLPMLAAGVVLETVLQEVPRAHRDWHQERAMQSSNRHPRRTATHLRPRVGYCHSAAAHVCAVLPPNG